MKRKQAQKILNDLGVTNKFSLEALSFSDLARSSAQVLAIKDWWAGPTAQDIIDAFWPYGVLVEFDR